MNSKNASILCTVTMLVTVAFSHAQNVELTKLGTNALTVDGGSTTSGYSQTATTLVFTNFSGGNNALAGLFNAPLDWSAYTNAPYVAFALNMSVSGVNPDTDFSVDFYGFDGENYGIIDTYDGFTTGIGGTLTLNELAFSAPGALTGDYSAVYGIGFNFNGTLSSPNTVTVESVYATVPEPSTYALLGLSGMGLAGYVIRRRRA